MSQKEVEAVRYRVALAKLPAAYASALQLRDDGASDQRVAEALGIDVTGVPALMAIAEAKLQALVDAYVGDA